MSNTNEQRRFEIAYTKCYSMLTQVESLHNMLSRLVEKLMESPDAEAYYYGTIKPYTEGIRKSVQTAHEAVEPFNARYATLLPFPVVVGGRQYISAHAAAMQIGFGVCRVPHIPAFEANRDNPNWEPPPSAKDLEPSDYIHQCLSNLQRHFAEGFMQESISKIVWDIKSLCYREMCFATQKSDTSPSNVPVPIILTPIQERILECLNGRILQKPALAKAIGCESDPSRIYVNQTMKVLRTAQLVAHKKGKGYYRPDAPPINAVLLPSKK